MKYRFNNFTCKAAKLLVLTPSVLCSEKFKENVDIFPIFEEYGEHLINKDVVDQELLLWQRKWLAVGSVAIMNIHRQTKLLLKAKVQNGSL